MLDVVQIQTPTIFTAFLTSLKEVGEKGRVLDPDSGTERKEFDFVTIHVTSPGWEFLSSQEISKTCKSYLDLQVPIVSGILRDTPMTNQSTMSNWDLSLIHRHPANLPQLRIVDLRHRYGKLHLVAWFSSLDLGERFIGDLGYLQFLKMKIAKEIQAGDGELIVCTKSLYLSKKDWIMSEWESGFQGSANPTLKSIFINATSIEDAWRQAITSCTKNGFRYPIERGSFAGQERIEFDFVTLQMTYPETRPLAPIMPPGCGFGPPTSDEEIETKYFPNYLMNPVLEENEQYRYSTWIVAQHPEIVKMYQSGKYHPDKAFMAIGDPTSVTLSDPPCLRCLDTKIIDGKLHLFVYMRSWDLFAGFPENLGGFQCCKEMLVSEISEKTEILPGETIACSKGLHIYDHFEPLAEVLGGKSL